jgi:type IV pilus assembly protein PilF
LDDNNPSAANNYGRILCAQGKYEQGLQSIHKAIDSKHYLTPWLALTNAGICYKQQGKAAEAESYFRKALEYGPTFTPALLEMAKVSLENGNYLSARAFLERFDAVSSPTAESLFIGYQAEHASGNQKEAANHLKKLRRFFPNSKEAQRLESQRN